MASPPEFSRWQQAVFTVLMVLIVVVVCAFPAWTIYKKSREWSSMVTKKTTIEPNVAFFRGDPELGFKGSPGNFVFTERNPQFPGELRYKVTIGEDGYRVTSRNPGAFDGKPEVWVFGCSFTWGQGINDEDTFAWKAQERLPGYKIRNFGENGYGTVHALFQLRRLLAEGKKPAAVVFAYIPWHDNRNVAQPTYIRALYWFTGFQSGVPGALKEAGVYYWTKLIRGREAAAKKAKFHYPRAYLDEAGTKLTLTTVPMLPEIEYEYDKRTTDVTRAVFDELFAEAVRAGVVPIVLRLWNPPNGDALDGYFEKKGFYFQDAHVHYSEPEWNTAPHNGHPNAKGNQVFADGLVTAVESALKPKASRAGSRR